VSTQAGGGFTLIDTAIVEVVVQGIVFTPSPNATADLFTRAGAWCRIRSIFVDCNNLLALASNTLRVTALTNLVPVYSVAASFSVGPAQSRLYTMSLYGDNMENTNAGIVQGSLPDIWLPPNSQIVTQWIGGDGIGTLSQGRITYEVATNVGP
jgi:hypothetical protein